MRVSLVNVNLVGPDATGQCLLNQLRFFLRRGDDVRIYVMHPPVDVDEAVAERVEVVSLPELLKQQQQHFHTSDLYVYHYPGRYDLMETLPGLERGAVVFYYHNVTPPELWADEADREHLAHSLDSVRVFARYSDLIVTDSQFNADQLVGEHGCDADRVIVLPLAVPLDRFVLGPKDLDLVAKLGLGEKPVVLFVGRMASNKRIDLLVEALSHVRMRVPDAVLLLVGDDCGNPAIQRTAASARERAADLGLTDAVRFAGRVDDLAAYYSIADVYATASLHEGFGVPLIEAMASGRPVVASDVASQAWVLDGAGLLTRPGDPEDIADKIVQVLTDDGLYGELVTRGVARARRFSLAQYEVGWAEAVLRAIAWLPDQPVGPAASTGEHAEERDRPGSRGSERGSALPNSLRRELINAADIVDHEYMVRSGLPILGPLIVWFRHNLTSHVSAYLHPLLDRQVRYNQLIGDALLWLGSCLPVSERPATQEAGGAGADRFEELSRRLGSIEARLRDIEARLCQDDGTNGVPVEDVNKISDDIAGLGAGLVEMKREP